MLPEKRAEISSVLLLVVVGDSCRGLFKDIYNLLKVGLALDSLRLERVSLIQLGLEAEVLFLEGLDLCLLISLLFKNIFGSLEDRGNLCELLRDGFHSIFKNRGFDSRLNCSLLVLFVVALCVDLVFKFTFK
jgi:hypothetical protein